MFCSLTKQLSETKIEKAFKNSFNKFKKIITHKSNTIITVSKRYN